MSEDKQALVRRAGKDAKGRFTKGHTLAQGRKKGSKNRATLVREQMKQSSTLMLGRMAPHLMKKALSMALEGDKDLLKMFTKTMLGDGKDQDKGPNRVEVVINNLTAPIRPKVEAEVLDVEVSTQPMELTDGR